MTTGRSTSPSVLALVFALSTLAACGGDPSAPTETPTATVSGYVRDGAGPGVAGASVSIGGATATTNSIGQFQLEELPVGSATIVTTAAGFETRSESIELLAGNNEHDVALTFQVATVSGVVTAATGELVEGALVKIGAATTTTGADGRFELTGLRVGGATIATSAPRFDARSQSVTLSQGANVHDVVLQHRTLYTYGNAVAYLPREVARFRAAIVFLPGLRDPATGLDLDSRGLVRGDQQSGCSIWCDAGERAVVRSRALELLDGEVALVGTTTLLPEAPDFQTILNALDEFAAQSLRPELAEIPILFVGHSMGGCTAYGFTREHGARVAGFLTMKGACHNLGPALAAADVPGHFLIGDLDAPYRRENITAVFDAGRAGGAPWAISIDPYFHGPIVDFDMMFDWIDAVLAARLSLTPGDPLRAVTETEGWLGDRSSGAISSYACYGATRSSASWLPSAETALDWQRMAGGTVVVDEC